MPASEIGEEDRYLGRSLAGRLMESQYAELNVVDRDIYIPDVLM